MRSVLRSEKQAMMKAESRYRGGVQVLGGGVPMEVFVSSMAGYGEGSDDGRISTFVEMLVSVCVDLLLDCLLLRVFIILEKE